MSVPTTVQLRRYELDPDLADEFLAWFPEIVKLRDQFGFRVLFTYYDPEQHEFTWAVTCDGDFHEVEQAYTTSPQRAALFAGRPKFALAMHVAMVVDPFAAPA